MTGGSGAEPGVLNRAIMAASRALVPMDYTTGDRFVHDPALPMPAWPVLQPLRVLAETAPESEAARFALVDAVRARNRIAYALRTGRDAFREAK